MRLRWGWIEAGAIAFMALALVSPILGPRWFRSHDFIQYPVRLQQLHLTLVEGGRTGGWYPDFALGFGLPWLQYYAPGFLLLAELFHLLGGSLFAALQAAALAGALAGAAGAYALGRELAGRPAGLAAAALFTFMPYHVLNLLVRGGLYEFAAQGLMPWILWGLARTARRSDPVGLWTAAGALSTLAVTHNISALLAMPVAIVWGLAMAAAAPRPRLRALVRVALPLAAGLILAAWFWLPALATTGLVSLEVMTRGFGDYRNHFIAWWQLFDPYWNFGASVRGTGDSLNLEIGNLALAAAAIGLAGWRRTWGADRRRRLALAALAAVLVVSAALTHRLAAPVWAHLPLLRIVQFPYRLLAPAGLAAALLGAAAPAALAGTSPRRACLAAGILALAAFGLAVPRLRVAGFYELSAAEVDRALVRAWRDTFATGEYVPRGVTGLPPPRRIDMVVEREPPAGRARAAMEARLEAALARRPMLEFLEPQAWQVGSEIVGPQAAEVLDPGIEVRAFEVDGAGLRFEFRAERPGRVRCGQLYFPGWRARLAGGSPLPVEPDPATGLVVCRVPAGTGTVQAWFGLTGLRRLARLISLAGLAGLALFSLLSARGRA